MIIILDFKNGNRKCILIFTFYSSLLMDGWSRRRPRRPPPSLSLCLWPFALCHLYCVILLPFVLCHFYSAISSRSGCPKGTKSCSKINTCTVFLDKSAGIPSQIANCRCSKWQSPQMAKSVSCTVSQWRSAQVAECPVFIADGGVASDHPHGGISSKK